MHRPPHIVYQGGLNARTLTNMKRKREVIHILENHSKTPKGRAARARKTAKMDGVSLTADCAWVPTQDDNWVFGPDPLYDNIYQCVPQVLLGREVLLRANIDIYHNTYTNK